MGRKSNKFEQLQLWFKDKVKYLIINTLALLNKANLMNIVFKSVYQFHPMFVFNSPFYLLAD